MVVDGELATADEVAALQAQGTTVLAYLSVGTIEKWRSWYPRAQALPPRAPWADWKDEWFADVSKAGLRRILTEQIAPEILAKGFDGLFLDNVDMIETRNHIAQRDGMRKLVLALAELAHFKVKLLFTQNGAWGLRKLGLLDAIDGWNREDVTLDLRLRQPALRAHPSGPAAGGAARVAADGRPWAGRPPRPTTRAGRRAGAGKESVAASCSVGALPYVGDIGLTARRLPDPPLTC